MIPILNFLEAVLQALLGLLLLVVIVYAILSWLIAFDVVNLRNRFVYQLSRGVEALALPVLRPFQRVVPNLGGMDFSPILLFIVVGAARSYLIPPFFEWLRELLGGPVPL